MHGFKDPDIHEIERSCPTQELSSINNTLQILASTTSEGTLADGEKAFMQGDSSVRDEPLCATQPPEGLPGVPEGALIRLDREVYGLVSGMSGWRSRILSQLKEEGHEMNVYEACLFSKFAMREEPAVDGGSLAPGKIVGCVLLEVDDHLMGGPGKAHHEACGRHQFCSWSSDDTISSYIEMIYLKSAHFDQSTRLAVDPFPIVPQLHLNWVWKSFLEPLETVVVVQQLDRVTNGHQVLNPWPVALQQSDACIVQLPVNLSSDFLSAGKSCLGRRARTSSFRPRSPALPGKPSSLRWV